MDESVNKILEFLNPRDWLQVHDPKNLAEAISIEAGEHLEQPDQYIYFSANKSKYNHLEE